MKQLYVQSKNRTEYYLNKIKRYLHKYTTFEIAITIICLIFILWFSLSIIDICNNNMGSCNYAAWNLITKMF